MTSQRFKTFSIVLACVAFLAGCENSPSLSVPTPPPTATSSASTQNADSASTSPTSAIDGSTAVPSTSNPTQAPSSTVSSAPVAITTKTVSWNGQNYQFIQTCIGQQKIGKFLGDETKPINFCLGKNILNMVESHGKTLEIASLDTTDPTAVPLLIDAQLVPGSKNGTVLLSYKAESCTTTDDCGPGMPSNYVTMAVDLKDQAKRTLANYPEKNTAMWNSSGSKALFLPVTCSGGGCDVDALIGYNVVTDTQNDHLTAEKAAAFFESGSIVDYSTATGEKLPHWQSVSWTSDSKFKAVIVQVDGKTKTISRNF